jgi:hypothetical protein
MTEAAASPAAARFQFQEDIVVTFQFGATPHRCDARERPNRR